MPAFWLKMIGTATNPCPDPYKLRYADFTRRPRIRVDDRLLLYAVGGFKNVFALATVVSAVKPSGVDRWPFRVDLDYEVNLRPIEGVDIETANLELHLPAIRYGNSHLSLTEVEFAYAATKLRQYAKKKLKEWLAK